jgi:RNA polymerase sigma-70 factor (ECF subfamily)
VCYDQIRRRRRHLRLDADRPRAPAADPGATTDLHDLIDRLDPDRRAAFVLTQLHGLSYQEAAEVCACPVGTIRSRVARARIDLVGGYAVDADAPNGESGR